MQTPLFIKFESKGGNGLVYDVGKCLLADRLSQTRMTQQELADALGVTRQQIFTYTSNTRMMSLRTAKNIAAILNCEIGELYEWKRVGKRH